MRLAFKKQVGKRHCALLKELTQIFFCSAIFDTDLGKLDTLGLHEFTQFCQGDIFFFVKPIIYKGNEISNMYLGKGLKK
jgi:hypothetical protein